MVIKKVGFGKNGGSSNLPKTIRYDGVDYRLLGDDVELSYSSAERITENLIKNFGPHFRIFEFPDKTRIGGFSFHIYSSEKEVDVWSDYETGYEDRMIGSLKKIKTLAVKRLVLGTAVEKALKTGRSVATAKRVSDMGIKVCTDELKELLDFTDALLRDKLLRLARKGKLGGMTKEEMISDLRKFIDEFGGSYKELIAETEESRKDKDMIALFDRFNKLIVRYETNLSRFYDT